MIHRAPSNLLAAIAFLGSTAWADVIHVPGDFPTIQQAIDASFDGDEVIVSSGVFVENIDFLDKDIIVRSADPSDPDVVAATIIDGDNDPQNPGTVVTLSAGTITGFTITGGYGNSGNPTEDAGGVFATDLSSVTNNVISDNFAPGSGGGIYARDNAIVANNSILANQCTNFGGGARLLLNVVFTNNIVANNQAIELNGGGVYAGGDVRITNCLIDGNQANTSHDGGGVLLGNDSVLEGCTITNNSAFAGGGVQAYGRSIVRNNIITGNTAEVAAGARLGNGPDPETDVVFIGNIVSGNAANQGTGAVRAYGRSLVANNVAMTNTAGGVGSAITVTDDTQCLNNTVVSNTAGIEARQHAVVANNIVVFSVLSGGVYASNDHTGLMDYNCVFGNVGGDYTGAASPGRHDINQDPLLSFGGFHLTGGSPCINSGFGGIEPGVLTGEDVDGDPRIQSCRVEIGADEIPGVPTTLLSVSTIPNTVIEVTPRDCEGAGSGMGSFNRSYTVPEFVTLTVADDAGFDRWVVNEVDQPAGQTTIVVDMIDHVAATAVFSIIRVPDDSPTIQAAINSAFEGSLIVVSEGTYFENIDFLGKDITVQSTNPLDPGVVASTIIDGGNSGPVVSLSTGRISGFTIRNGQTSRGGGVKVEGPAVVSHNVIRDNHAHVSGGGVYLAGDLAGDRALGNAVLANNIITLNSSHIFGGGVHARSDSSIVVSNVISFNTAEENGGGVYATYDPVITGNTIVANAAFNSGGGIHARDVFSRRVRLANNIIAYSTFGGGLDATISVKSDFNCVFGNSGGDYLGPLPPGANDVNLDPMLDVDGFHLLPGSPCISAGNPALLEPDLLMVDVDGEPRLLGCGLEIGADEVTDSPVFALIILAPGRASISVTQADCNGDAGGMGAFNRFYLDPVGVTLTASSIPGSFFVRWIVDGLDQPPGQMTASVDVTGYTTAVAVYSSTLVPADYPTVQDAVDAAVVGTVVVVEPGEYVELVTIDEDVLVRSMDPDDPNVVESTILSASFIQTYAVVRISAGEISGFTIRNGAGGVYAGSNTNVIGTGIVSHNLIIQNAGFWGGIASYGESIIRYNRITENQASYRGGGLRASGSTRAVSNVIFGNSALEGGGIAALSTFEGDPFVSNNLVFDNVATTGAGCFAEGTVTVVNNIVTANSGGSGIFVDGCCGDPVLIDYNCLFDNSGGPYGGAAQPGAGDLTVDPMLDADGIHLLPDSPCIDAGDPDFVPMEGETDIDGDPRVLDGRVDIGADEFRLGDANGADSVDAFRGFYVSGDLDSLQESDDDKLCYNPGIVLNQDEAPVTLDFFGTLPNDSPSTLDVTIESSANTVGLELTISFWNYNTNSWDVVGVEEQTFAADTVRTFAGTPADHVEPGTGEVRTRYEVRQVSFIFLFPWLDCVDHVFWTITN